MNVCLMNDYDFGICVELVCIETFVLHDETGKFIFE